MDLSKTAEEIIRLLVSIPEDGLSSDCDPQLLRAVERCRKHGPLQNWTAAIARCRQQYDETSGECMPKAEYWKGVGWMYAGASRFEKSRAKEAREYFRKAGQIFEIEDCLYSYGIALLAQGLACRALGKNKETLVLYAQSYRVFRGLQERCELWYHPSRLCRYQDLCDVLQGRIQEIKEVGLHLIPLIGEAVAGRHLYTPGESNPGSVSEINLSDRKYQLLSLKNRKLKSLKFKSDKKYFVLKVSGDSMIQANILDKDLLLAIAQTVWPSKQEIVVVQEEDHAPMVKRYCYDASSQTLLLKSENPEYPSYSYKKGSSEIPRLLGIVIGILKELEF